MSIQRRVHTTVSTHTRASAHLTAILVHQLASRYPTFSQGSVASPPRMPPSPAFGPATREPSMAVPYMRPHSRCGSDPMPRRGSEEAKSTTRPPPAPGSPLISSSADTAAASAAPVQAAGAGEAWSSSSSASSGGGSDPSLHSAALCGATKMALRCSAASSNRARAAVPTSSAASPSAWGAPRPPTGRIQALGPRPQNPSSSSSSSSP
mmetsp:Transcript_2332/g.9105  ORF Transcript_2332/g.9105 Transcript_2332/m.9105 type:complete len:208 (+) Transcript_2332:213-836(+)